MRVGSENVYSISLGQQDGETRSERITISARNRFFEEGICEKNLGGGGGSRTRVRKCYWSEDYMRSRVHASGITQRRSRPRLRTDKKPLPLA